MTQLNSNYTQRPEDKIMSRIETIIRNLPLVLLLMLAASMARASTLDDIATALENGQTTEAQAMLDALGDDATAPEAQLLQGQLWVQTNQLDEAFELLSQVAEARPDNADAQYWLGAAAGSLAANVSMFKAGKYARIVKRAFTRTIEIDPEYEDAYAGLISFHLQAPRIVGGSKKEAQALAEKLQTLDPLQGGLSLVDVYRQTRREDEARELLKAMAESMPDEPRAWSSLGFQAQGDEDWETAHEAFSKGAKAGDDSLEQTRARLGALYQVGRTAVFANTNLEAGIAALDDYLKADLPDGLPGKDWAHYRKGLLLEASDNKSAALTAYTNAKAITEDEELLAQLGRKL